MEPEIDHGVIVWHKGNNKEYVIERFVMDKTRDEGMVLYRRGNEYYVRTVDNFKDRFYVEGF